MKNIGIIYNSFVCFVIGLLGFAVFYLSRKKRKAKKINYGEGLDYFFLFLGIVWILSGIGTFFNWLGRPEIGRLMFKWFLGGFIYVHLVPAFYYFGWSFFEERKTIQKIFNLVFTAVSFAAVFTLAKYGFTQPEMTYWGADVVPNKSANNIFTFGLFLPGFIAIIIELVKRYKKLREKDGLRQKQLFGFALGFFIYAIGGVFDGLGSIRAWMILLARSIIMISLIVFYFSCTLDE